MWGELVLTHTTKPLGQETRSNEGLVRQAITSSLNIGYYCITQSLAMEYLLTIVYASGTINTVLFSEASSNFPDIKLTILCQKYSGYCKTLMQRVRCWTNEAKGGWLLTTANRFGLRSSKRDLNGLMSINELDAAPVDAGISLSIPLVPGWLVSGKKKRMDKNITAPASPRIPCMMRHDA
jgi:hypothetical protein